MPGKLARAPGMSSASEGAALTAQNCMEIFNWQDEELQNLSLCLILLSYDSSPRSRPTRQMQRQEAFTSSETSCALQKVL